MKDNEEVDKADPCNNNVSEDLLPQNAEIPQHPFTANHTKHTIHLQKKFNYFI